MQSAASTIDVLTRLKAQGVRVSIDDFGIGYSSLSYLRQLPIDTLKIDQSFVRNIATVRGDSAIVTAVIVMAHALKLDVVAEGVETGSQLAFLGARRCDRIQGFFFSPAVCPEELKPLLAAGSPARPSPRSRRSAKTTRHR
jgi:EAL domain-containing protein (putative c-di-GMP-specific phosphodiesterase class I)